MYLFMYVCIYLFILRERGSEGEREGEKHQCAGDTLIGCFLYAPNQELGLQPGHVP